MMNYPKISIVTPSYNQCGYIEQTINSIISQNYPNFEYIIMDGGSSDGSVDIIRKYSKHLAHWESGPDRGQADAIYRGFEYATGDILGWVNSDDLLLPGCLEKVGRYFATHKQETWLVGGAILIGSDNQILYNRIRSPKCNLGLRVTFHHLLFLGCTFNQPASFWRRDAFFNVGGFDRSLRFCFDYDLYLRLSQQRPSGNIRDFLACFRIHPYSKSSTIPDICRAENYLLWRKYGRYKKSKLYRQITAQYHIKYYLLRLRFIQLKLLLGVLKCPWAALTTLPKVF